MTAPTPAQVEAMAQELWSIIEEYEANDPPMGKIVDRVAHHIIQREQAWRARIQELENMLTEMNGALSNGHTKDCKSLTSDDECTCDWATFLNECQEILNAAKEQEAI